MKTRPGLVQVKPLSPFETKRINAIHRYFKQVHITRFLECMGKREAKEKARLEKQKGRELTS